MTISPEQLKVKAQEKQDPLVAFGGFVKPEIYYDGDFDPDTLTDKEKEWMTPATISSILFNRDFGEDLVYRGIKFNAYEHKLLAHYPAKLAETAMKGVLKDKDITDDVMGKKARSRVHILQSKADYMKPHIEKLKVRQKDVERLQKEIRTPGFAHVRASEMSRLINHTYQEFITILDVLHIDRDWDEQTRRKAELALVNYLTQGGQRDRVSHWRQMAELSRSYLLARRFAFKHSLNSVNKQLNLENVETL
jgi:hypothetical protein